MSSAQASNETATTASSRTGPALRYEVTVLPVADVDRAKAFYVGLGWRLDADFPIDEHYRIVQLTPPGSPTSIQLGTGITTMSPGSLEEMYLVVDDIEAARADLIAHGADVSEVWHGRGLGPEGHAPGRDPDGASYRSFASFADPDGNRWLLQEISERLPGRLDDPDIGDLAGLLGETAIHHGAFEAVAPPHDWWDWYAAYMQARVRGRSSEQAAADAGRYMADVKGIVVPTS
jgi:catechol 2,3-dioxygenase-like lactoylglutathione lyase family enzyme